jgi:hypothetical protein
MISIYECIFNFVCFRQSLKQLSASAPAMRTDLGKNSEKGELFMAPSSSKSRQKKFHRHFKTVPQEEKVLDCK